MTKRTINSKIILQYTFTYSLLILVGFSLNLYFKPLNHPTNSQDHNKCFYYLVLKHNKKLNKTFSSVVFDVEFESVFRVGLRN